MIQDDIQKFLNSVKAELDTCRFQIVERNFILPDVDELQNNSKALIQFVRTAYLTLLEGYGKNMLKSPKYELHNEIESFLLSQNADFQAMVKFLVDMNMDRSLLLSKYYGFFDDTCYSFGDLAGCVTFRLSKLK